MVFFLLCHSMERMGTLRDSTLPLRGRRLGTLCVRYLGRIGDGRAVPVCDATFLGSPILTNFLRPHVCLPVRLVSSFGTKAVDSASVQCVLLRRLRRCGRGSVLVKCLVGAMRIFC